PHVSTLSLHDALPISADAPEADLHVVDEDDRHELAVAGLQRGVGVDVDLLPPDAVGLAHGPDRATCRVAQVTPLAAEELHAFSHAPSPVMGPRRSSAGRARRRAVVGGVRRPRARPRAVPGGGRPVAGGGPAPASGPGPGT